MVARDLIKHIVLHWFPQYTWRTSKVEKMWISQLILLAKEVILFMMALYSMKAFRQSGEISVAIIFLLHFLL